MYPFYGYSTVRNTTSLSLTLSIDGQRRRATSTGNVDGRNSISGPLHIVIQPSFSFNSATSIMENIHGAVFRATLAALDAAALDDRSTVPAKDRTGRKPSLARYRGALEALSNALSCIMTDANLVQSGLPSSLKSLLYEEQSRVRRLQRLNLRQSRMDSFCSR